MFKKTKYICCSIIITFIEFFLNSFAYGSNFEQSFGKISIVGSNFTKKEIILKCDEKFQKGPKIFTGFISSDYVWAYRKNQKFINLLFGYKTKGKGFKIEILEKKLKMKHVKYYSFHDKNNSNPEEILSNSFKGYKLKSKKKWFSCVLHRNNQQSAKSIGVISKTIGIRNKSIGFNVFCIGSKHT